jgi:glutathione S-transferase
MPERILYVGPLSLFSRKVEIALREKGLGYERVLVPFTQEVGYQPKHPVVARSNPKRQVPVLIEGDLTLFDSTVIFEYLEDAYPAPPLYPREARARARCRLVELEADEILFAPVRNLLYRTEPPLPDALAQARREAAGTEAEADLARQFAGLGAVAGRRLVLRRLLRRRYRNVHDRALDPALEGAAARGHAGARRLVCAVAEPAGFSESRRGDRGGGPGAVSGAGLGPPIVDRNGVALFGPPRVVVD